MGDLVVHSLGVEAGKQLEVEAVGDPVVPEVLDEPLRVGSDVLHVLQQATGLALEVLHDPVDQGLLGGEVVQHSRMRHADVAGDGTQASPVIPVPGDDLRGTVKDPLSPRQHRPGRGRLGGGSGGRGGGARADPLLLVLPPTRGRCLGTGRERPGIFRKESGHASESRTGGTAVRASRSGPSQWDNDGLPSGS